MGEVDKKQKIVIYQVLPRLFGNTKTTNKKWGTIEENGVGKFNDFTDAALKAIKELGVTHIWFTGILHHMTMTDYSQYGIDYDPPAIVKGRAGSPYAIKDYYNVDPDLAVNPSRRLDEFEALIERTHCHGMKVIIDLVPNHVARKYQSISKPAGVKDFGQNDDNTVEYKRDNNFYYIVGQNFKLPCMPNDNCYGKEDAGEYDELPAKWTGNKSDSSQPELNDWYDTVKINFGIRPDGSNDFDVLPEAYLKKSVKKHYEFWQEKTVPDSWLKFREIALFWLKKGVDGFRYDMAEMVPVEFWSYMNSAIKMSYPYSLLLAEIYKPELYRSYLNQGKMDYLYDKEDFYDTMKCIMQGSATTDCIHPVQEGLQDIEQHMLHFLENHDEERIASEAFAQHAENAKPAMVVTACISSSPTMIYFGQELGEPARENAGFGGPNRTTIYDYWAIDTYQRWVNNGAFDGAQLSAAESALRNFYQQVLTISISHDAFTGKYQDIHRFNRYYSEFYNDRLFSFVRCSEDERIIIASNFSSFEKYGFDLKLPEELLSEWGLSDGDFTFIDLLTEKEFSLNVIGNISAMRMDLEPLESVILLQK